MTQESDKDGDQHRERIGENTIANLQPTFVRFYLGMMATLFLGIVAAFLWTFGVAETVIYTTIVVGVVVLCYGVGCAITRLLLLLQERKNDR